VYDGRMAEMKNNTKIDMAVAVGREREHYDTILYVQYNIAFFTIIDFKNARERRTTKKTEWSGLNGGWFVDQICGTVGRKKLLIIKILLPWYRIEQFERKRVGGVIIPHLQRQNKNTLLRQ